MYAPIRKSDPTFAHIATKPFPDPTIWHSKSSALECRLFFWVGGTEMLIGYTRHRRTHEARPDGEVGSFSEEELEIEEQEFGAVEDESPSPEQNTYIANGMPMLPTTPLRNGMHAGGMAAPSQLMAAPTMLPQQI